MGVRTVKSREQMVAHIFLLPGLFLPIQIYSLNGSGNERNHNA